MNNPTLDEALVVLGEMFEVADTEGMDDETIIPVWPKDVAHDFAPLRVKHIRAIMRAFSSARRAEVAPMQWEAIGYVGPGMTVLWEPGREPEKGALLYRPISGPLRSPRVNNG